MDSLLRAEFVVYHFIVVPIVAFLPAALAYGVAILRGDLVYRLDSSSRGRITNVLTRVLGEDLSLEDRARVARDWFRLRSCEAVDSMRLAGNGRALARHVITRGLEHIEAALADGKGAILCSAHFGYYCWPLIGSMGFPITTVTYSSPTDSYRNLSRIDRFLNRIILDRPLQQHMRHPNILRREGSYGVAVKIAILLRRNELIVSNLEHMDYNDDPTTPIDGAPPITADFLGVQVPLLPGIITIAQLTRAPVMIVSIHRSADWRHQVLEISPPISMEGDDITIFRRCLAVVEAVIRRDPAQWKGWNWFRPNRFFPDRRGQTITPS